ncbi:hypothetical protein [Stenotrophomonas rhizophila]|uniref:hypothetical protein n=1 Tax=Stenotrophomonas rhizophila TaxID=216778 RepID=UPI0028D188D6|nr:hypothetical protein [Stenotrophomonas rhizophila]
MSDKHDPQDEWNGLMDHWQAQPTPSQDLDALQREAERHGTRLRMVAGVELVIAALALGNCARALAMGTRNPIPVPVLLALMALVVASTGWRFWQRRRYWRAPTLDPRALIAFEQGRAIAALRLWRGSTWLATALWVALTVWAMNALQAGVATPMAPSALAWQLNVGLNAAVLLVCAVAAWGMGRRHRRRLQHLRVLSESLDGE